MRTNYFLSVKNLLSGLIILCVAISCKKEKQDHCSPTKATIAGTYKVTAFTYKETSTSPSQDYLLLKDPCELDDLLEFNANGNYTYRDMGVVCSPDGSDVGSWSVIGNTIISDGIVAGTIQSFDCHTLVVYTDNIFIPGDRITLTIVRQ
jgi:Lipocalin-like domain